MSGIRSIKRSIVASAMARIPTEEVKKGIRTTISRNTQLAGMAMSGALSRKMRRRMEKQLRKTAAGFGS